MGTHSSQLQQTDSYKKYNSKGAFIYSEQVTAALP